jgi:hypothetical protein
VADVPCLPELPQLIRLKYLTAVNRWTGLPCGAVSLAGPAGGDLSRSLMWRELCRYQVTDIASSVYRDRFGCWGFLDLWRTQGSPPFPATDIEFLGHIAEPVTAALRRSQAATFVPGAASGQLPEGPVVVLRPGYLTTAETPPSAIQRPASRCRTTRPRR